MIVHLSDLHRNSLIAFPFLSFCWCPRFFARSRFHHCVYCLGALVMIDWEASPLESVQSERAPFCHTFTTIFDQASWLLSNLLNEVCWVMT